MLTNCYDGQHAPNACMEHMSSAEGVLAAGSLLVLRLTPVTNHLRSMHSNADAFNPTACRVGIHDSRLQSLTDSAQSWLAVFH